MTPEALKNLGASGAPVHVVGLASTEGTAMVRFLWQSGIRNITVHDFLHGEDLAKAFFRLHVGMPRDERRKVWDELSSLPVVKRFGPDYLVGVEAAAAVFVGQGWYLYDPNFPKLPTLREQGVPFHSLTELYFDLCPVPIVAVTGSNGKSTTSRMVESILTLRPQGHTYFAGNERRSAQVLDKLASMVPPDLLVLEVSNRQLLDLRGSPKVGVLTNVLPNHLDEHGGSFATYRGVKRRLFEGQSRDDHAVLNADDQACLEIADGLAAQTHWFSLQPPSMQGMSRDLSAWFDDGRLWVRLRGQEPEAVLEAAQLPVPGLHNVANALAAALAARLAGASSEAASGGLRRLRPLRHRLQLAWRHAGVSYYDDLNSTSPQAAAAALKALEPGVIWIAGGDDKGLDFADLAEVARGRVRRVLLLPGSGSEKLANALAADLTLPVDEQTFSVVEHKHFADAVAEAVAVARPGESVLLSPACPGFFSRHYLDDGVESGGFRSLLRSLTMSAVPVTDGDEHPVKEET